MLLKVLLEDHHTDKDDHVAFNIIAIEIHERYNPQNFDNDFSMIKLSTEVDFLNHPNIRPICLPSFNNDTFAGVTATVSGWGTTSYLGSQSTVLKEVNVTVLGNSECKYA